MNTKVEKLLDDLEQIAELHRKSADDLEARIKEIRRVAKEGDDDYLYLTVIKIKEMRYEFSRHQSQISLANYEARTWYKLHDETLINAAACAEKDET